MKLYKAHGLGNDYLVLEDAAELDAGLVVALCDRHRGVGGDGILEPFAAGDAADFGVRIWNPDGSIAEKSGNGLRIFARWLVSERGAPPRFSLWTGSCRVVCDVEQDTIRVDMGDASFEPADVPVQAEQPLIDGELALSNGVLSVTAVGIGNPHCVIFRQEPLESLPFREWGAEVERHPRFPNRTNVQLARVLDRRTVEILDLGTRGRCNAGFRVLFVRGRGGRRAHRAPRSRPHRGAHAGRNAVRHGRGRKPTTRGAGRARGADRGRPGLVTDARRLRGAARSRLRGSASWTSLSAVCIRCR